MIALRICLQSLRSLRRYRLRSFFMMLGIVIGIASLAVLNSIGENTRRVTMQRFKNMLGTFDTIMVRPGGGKFRGMPTLVNVPPTLKFDDAAAIASQPEIKSVAEIQNAFDIDVKYRDRTASPAIFGVSPSWFGLRSDELETGSLFTDEQNTSLARVAVLGPDARRTLFADEDPIGKTIRIANVPFLVIGTLKPRGAGPAGGSLDNLIFLPVNTASRRLFNRDFLTMLIAQIKDKDENQSDQVTEKITQLLRERHHIRPPALDDFTVTNPRATMARVTRAGSTLSRILTGVAAMALLIGGIVIMGLMSIAVSERRKEIGVRRSVGATQRDILVQFLAECVLIAICGGVSGALLGWGGMELAAKIQKLPGVLVWQPFLLAIALSVIVGIGFGVYPAWRASKIDPIQALRS
jgi:putative ABC transport system permease protein